MINYYIYAALARSGATSCSGRQRPLAAPIRRVVPAAGPRIRRPPVAVPPAVPCAAARVVSWPSRARPGAGRAGHAARRVEGGHPAGPAAMTPRCWPTASPGSARSRGGCGSCAAKTMLSAAELRYFTDIDHHDHEALGALDHAGGRGVGVARYVRDTGDPHAAEIAVTVVDDWQGRGLGTELLARLSGRARAAGIHRFTALVSADNQAAAGLMRGARGDVVRREHGTVEYEIPLAPCEEPCDGLLIPLAG